VGRDHIGWSNMPSKQSIFFRGKSQTAMRISNPNRATHTYRQHLLAAPSKVFPLLCPVRETEWADGWLPEVVISVSGVSHVLAVGDPARWRVLIVGHGGRRRGKPQLQSDVAGHDGLFIWESAQARSESFEASTAFPQAFA